MRLTDEQRDEYTQGRLQEIEAENRRLRERLDYLERGLRALIAEYGGDRYGTAESRDTEDLRHLSVGSENGR